MQKFFFSIITTWKRSNGVRCKTLLIIYWWHSSLPFYHSSLPFYKHHLRCFLSRLFCFCFRKHTTLISYNIRFFLVDLLVKLLATRKLFSIDVYEEKAFIPSDKIFQKRSLVVLLQWISKNSDMFAVIVVERFLVYPFS